MLSIYQEVNPLSKILINIEMYINRRVNIIPKGYATPALASVAPPSTRE